MSMQAENQRGPPALKMLPNAGYETILWGLGAHWKLQHKLLAAILLPGGLANTAAFYFFPMQIMLVFLFLDKIMSFT